MALAIAISSRVVSLVCAQGRIWPVEEVGNFFIDSKYLVEDSNEEFTSSL
jgi:hypothetical protein